MNSHKENAVLAEKLRILELKNVGDLNLAKLKQLEKFYYKALDNTKDIKFMLKHVNDIGVCPVNSMELWKALDVPNDVDKIESGSDNSSLEFESSFYKSKRTTEISIDFNESSIVP